MVLIITPEEIIRETPMGGNVDIDKYRFLITDQQEIVIEPILGTNLYKKLLSEITAEVDSGIYFDLWQKCKPIVKFMVVSDFVEIANLNVLNGGVLKHQPENSQIAEQNEAFYLAKKQRIKADVYKERLQKWLKVNKDDLPEYKEQENDFDEKPMTNNGLTGGWYLK
jgi:hypothetical protein